jgi:hypothetical protein
VEGRLYLHLFHGRDRPDQSLDDWGFDGPHFGPLSAVHQTYNTELRTFPGRLVASIVYPGMKVRETFSISDQAKQVPTVKF